MPIGRLKQSIPESIKRPLRTFCNVMSNIVQVPARTFPKCSRILKNIGFAYTHRQLKQSRKILYAITPPPRLKNVGDHAQVVAIRAWLKKHFPELPAIEMDKDQARYYLPALRWLVQPRDIVFLHSGGNLGDRAIWSESIRRLLISTFPENQIVSLPQTIYFSHTPTGRRERENTRRIYATHPNLTIIARDPRSGELAAELFSQARTFCMPDFVLSLPPRPSNTRNDPPRVLLCLRLDDESALTEEQRKDIANHLPYPCTYYDTTLAEPIGVSEREVVLEHTLDLFRTSDVVVTDRYHGLIFAVLCRKPCVVLGTVDHKLTSAIQWFRDVSFVALAHDLGEIPSLVDRCLAIESRQVPDWNVKYFDKIPQLVDLR